MNWIKQDAYLICQKLQNDPFRLRIGNDFLSRGRNVISIIFNPVTKLKFKTNALRCIERDWTMGSKAYDILPLYHITVML